MATLLGLLATTSCELREIVTTNAQDVIVAEVVLRAESPVQTAYLYRTLRAGEPMTVTGASIMVVAQGSADTLRYFVAQDSLCLDARVPQRTGTCYAHFSAPAARVRAGGEYALRIEIPDGRVLTGTTRVPANFSITRPRVPGACRVAPDTTYELTWTRAGGTSVYLVGARLLLVGEALAARGIHVWGSDPVELTGLSVTAADTTLVVPSELGVFDRLDEELHPVLLAIRDGFPPGVRADIAIAAADANFVNWVRGGTFNPSGLVRISSVGGEGVGVFGSLVTHDLHLVVAEDHPAFQACG